MRFKIVLCGLLAVLLGCSLYAGSLLTGGAMTSRASAPALTSQQLAVIQAINTLLLSDDESADTLGAALY